jgi:hypothetical protein
MNNKASLAKMFHFMINGITNGKKYQVIVDEIHANIPTNIYDTFVSNIFRMIENGEDVTAAHIKGDREITRHHLTYLLFMMYAKYHTKIGMFGVTATTFSIINIPIIAKLRSHFIEFRTEEGETADCYVGYEKSDKKIFEMPGDAYAPISYAVKAILAENREFTMMSHVGSRKIEHRWARDQFIFECNEVGIDYCSIIHNGDGYTILGKRHSEHIIKKNIREPSEILVKCIHEYGYRHIGIFGDICMNMGNTYNNPMRDAYITDMVVQSIGRGVRPNNKKASEFIQKIGRASFNDVSGNAPKVTYWFKAQEEKERFDLFFRAERTCQEVCETTTFANANPRDIIRRCSGTTRVVTRSELLRNRILEALRHLGPSDCTSIFQYVSGHGFTGRIDAVSTECLRMCTTNILSRTGSPYIYSIV